MTDDKRTAIPSTLRQGWQQTGAYLRQNPVPRQVYYWAYAVFFCGFLFFPSSKGHNNFFYATLLVPSLIILGHLFATFRKNIIFNLIIAYLFYLVLTNFWGTNVSFENVAGQIKHLLYVLAFITASIVVEACYPEKTGRLLPIMAWTATLAFLVSTLWWYRTHPFPTERLHDILGCLDNPILASCIAGVACLALFEGLPKHETTSVRIAAGSALVINLTFIMLTQSRTALAALIPALLVLAIPYMRRNCRLLVITGALGLVIGFMLQDTLIAGFGRNSYRMDIWLATLEKIRPHLWWGQGYFCDTFALQIDGDNMRHAHNVFLATLRDGGIVGLLLLTGTVAAAGWSAWRQARATKHYLNLALVTFGTLAVFLDNDRLITNPEELWVFFWYPLCRVIAHDLVRDGCGEKPRLVNRQPSTPPRGLIEY